MDVGINQESRYTKSLGHDNRVVLCPTPGRASGHPYPEVPVRHIFDKNIGRLVDSLRLRGARYRGPNDGFNILYGLFRHVIGVIDRERCGVTLLTRSSVHW